MGIFIAVLLLAFALSNNKISRPVARDLSRMAARKELLASIAQQHNLADPVWASVLVGYERETRRLMVYRSDDNYTLIPADDIKVADLAVSTRQVLTMSRTQPSMAAS